MVGMVERPRLVGAINQAFSAGQIAATSARLAALARDPTKDAFDFVHELGLFNLPAGTPLAQYRGQLPIPALHAGVMTEAFRHSITDKIPLSLAIVGGHAEGVQVHSSHKLVSLVLTRVD